jgi:hypothetical protein
MDKNGDDVEFLQTGKVIYLSSEQIYSVGTLQCDVRAKETSSTNRAGNAVINDGSTYSLINDDGGNIELNSQTEYTTIDDGQGNVTVS